jgi:hypothetical protein
MLVGLTRSSGMPAFFAYSSFRSLTQASEMVWDKQEKNFPQSWRPTTVNIFSF